MRADMGPFCAPITKVAAACSVYYWPQENRWEGKDYSVVVE